MNNENVCKFCGKDKTSCNSSFTDASNMLKAVENNDLNKIKHFIEKGVSPNIHGNFCNTPLHFAVQCERADIVEYLLTLPDINLEQRSFYGTPLLLSVSLKNLEITNMLIKHGANLKVLDCNGDTVLHRAVLTRSPEIVRFILTEGIDMDVTDDDGYTPIHLAVSYNLSEIVSMLLYYGADISITDRLGFTPFMKAINNNCDEDIQRELFKYEYDYNRKTSVGCNTLFLAVLGGSPLIIDLIENKADVNDGAIMDDSILALILDKYDPDIFFYVFPLMDLTVLTECEYSIFTSLLRCTYSKENWLKALFLILESDLLSEFIDHYKLKARGNFFTKFAKVFREKNISEDEFVKFVEISLCSGADVTFEDIETVYQIYSNNKALPHLLNMKIENLPTFGYKLPYIFCNFDKHFSHVLNNYYGYEGNTCLQSSSVPSLLELSRNKAIIAICTRYNINSSHWYYYILRHLNLPQTIYDYLTFRRLIE